MSKQALVLANACAFELDKATTHRISVSLPHEVVVAIQDALPAAGALSWCLQHAAKSLYDWIKLNNGPELHRHIIDGVYTGRAFQRTTATVTPIEDHRPNDHGGTAAVHRGTPTPASAGSTESLAHSRGNTKTKRATPTKRSESRSRRGS